MYERYFSTNDAIMSSEFELKPKGLLPMFLNSTNAYKASVCKSEQFVAE